MKVFFASLTQPDIEVDAWVPTRGQGVRTLQALAKLYNEHDVIMRARLRRYQDYEERFIGAADDCSEFINRVKEMGHEALQS